MKLLLRRSPHWAWVFQGLLSPPSLPFSPFWGQVSSSLLGVQLEQQRLVVWKPWYPHHQTNNGVSRHLLNPFLLLIPSLPGVGQVKAQSR